MRGHSPGFTPDSFLHGGEGCALGLVGELFRGELMSHTLQEKWILLLQ